VAAIDLFTWNLTKETEEYHLALDHLAMLAKKGPFIACLQELPAASSIAQARSTPQPELAERNIAVVWTTKLVAGIALVHHPDLSVVGTGCADEDGEFIAAVFQRPADPKKVAVIGLHAKSKVDMKHAEDHGGARALLRHAIHALELKGDHQIVLGDFNSSLTSWEVQSWYGFYALSTNSPNTKPTWARRRGFDHPALYVVQPSNERMGTFALTDDVGGNERPAIDFIAVDKAAHAGASSRILTEVAGETVWDAVEEGPKPRHHLPVEGKVDI